MAECENCIHFKLCEFKCEETWDRDLMDANVCSLYTAVGDVVPKSEVDRLNAELVRLREAHRFSMTLFELQACEEHAANTAIKEVWRELRSMCNAPHCCVWLSEIDDYFERKTGVTSEDIAELKKKYTEDVKDDTSVETSE